MGVRLQKDFWLSVGVSCCARAHSPFKIFEFASKYQTAPLFGLIVVLGSVASNAFSCLHHVLLTPKRAIKACHSISHLILILNLINASIVFFFLLSWTKQIAPIVFWSLIRR
jgi:hypothetical protein